MIVAIHQPNLFPRLKVLQKLAFADSWIVLDDVQFAQREYQNRAYFFPTTEGQPPRWCSLPVSLPYGRDTRIQDVLASPGGISRVRNVLDACFSETGDAAWESLAGGYEPSRPLVSAGIATTVNLLKNVSAPHILLASQLRTEALPRSEGIAQLCSLVGADTYLADSGAAAYLDITLLGRSGVDVVWQVWADPGRWHDELDGIDCRNGSALNILCRLPDRYTELLEVTSFARSKERALQ
ncbi:MAG TPA: WbqC family protein [Jatrophihabitans sp.]|nr:WbqC family protein [Jatrophihabitans sp.]